MRNLLSKYQPTKWIRQTLAAKHERQLGTLGGGNHFVELVYDECDRVWMMLHSGSRNIGNVTAQHYLTDMTFCQAYALENRHFMMQAFAKIIKMETAKAALWSNMVNIHHNYCECERCRYYDAASADWKEENLWVTRKGATSAKKGQFGIIPGSMGTGSYIVRGRGEPDSWQSCSHGAGRSMSRA